MTLKPPRVRKGRREEENAMSHAFHAVLCAKNEASEEEAYFRGWERNDIWWYSGADT